MDKREKNIGGVRKRYWREKEEDLENQITQKNLTFEVMLQMYQNKCQQHHFVNFTLTYAH